MLDDWKKKWDELPPKKKHWTIYGVMFVVLVLVAQVFMAPPKTMQSQKKPVVDKSVFTDADAKKMGIDAMSAKIKSQDDALAKMRDQLSAMQRESDSARNTRPQNVDPEQLKQQLRDEVVEELKKSDSAKQDDASGVNPFDNPLEGGGKVTRPYTFSQENAGQGSQSGQKSGTPPPMPSGSNQGKTGVPEIRDIGGDNDQPTSAVGKSGDKNKKDTDSAGIPKDYIPSGSFLHGVLLTGMDAPTGKKLSSDPYPVLARVDKDTILPNFYSTDMRECFILANGSGDLSSERAYLRTTSLSCIRNDGGVVEVPLKAFAVGEDGKLGMRGRLVNKQGQILGRALIAGFAEALASAWNRPAVPVIATTAGSSPVYQNQLTGTGLESAGFQGAGKALDRLSQYYTDMAENLFPVIEIDAERHCEFVLSTGLSLANLKATTASDTPLQGQTYLDTADSEPIAQPVMQSNAGVEAPTVVLPRSPTTATMPAPGAAQ